MIYDLQKANMWKRISALLFDVIMLMILATGIGYVASVVTGYDGYNAKMTAFYEQYEKEYGIDFDISAEDFYALSEEEAKLYEEAIKALNNNMDAMQAYAMVINLTLLIITLSILLSYLVLEFVIPMFLGNGQTLGKKIFSLAVIRTDSVKITAPLLFIRTFLGKFTLETMIPVLIVIMIFFQRIGLLGTLILGGLLLLQCVLMIATQTNSVIHDLLAKTVVVDASSQMIFDSEEELLAYKQKMHAQQVARQAY